MLAGELAVGVGPPELTAVVEQLAPLVAELDMSSLLPEEAAELVGLFVRIERLAAAGRVQATRAVAKGEDVWKRAGFRSAAGWMASQAGLPTGTAIATLEMASFLDELPAVDVSFRSGQLSEAQMRAICEAAGVNPGAEQRLLDLADRSSLQELREECTRVVAAAIPDSEERRRRAHRKRCVRAFTRADGTGHIGLETSAVVAAQIMARVDARLGQITRDAKAGGWFESEQAHRADAFVELLLTGDDGEGCGPKATVSVFVDHAALVRGDTETGEVCEVPGMGPIPATDVARLLEDAYLNVLVKKGVDITVVAHAGRVHIPAHLNTALCARDWVCIVPGCGRRLDLERDHREDVVRGGLTSYESMGRLCRYHHYLKTKHGYTYRGKPGTWEWIPPERPTDPPEPDARE